MPHEIANIVPDSTGKVPTYALFKLQDRGLLMIEANDEISSDSIRIRKRRPQHERRTREAN